MLMTCQTSQLVGEYAAHTQGLLEERIHWLPVLIQTSHGFGHQNSHSVY
jgi:hypothetical protein